MSKDVQLLMHFEDFKQDLPLNDMPVGVTFKDSKSQPVHRWYPYVEGFSALWMNDKISSYQHKTKKIYDPFGGSGTTQLEASKKGIESYYSEINPFMDFVADTKINKSIACCKDIDNSIKQIKKYIHHINSEEFLIAAKVFSTEEFYTIFPDRDFFEETHLQQLLYAKHIADDFSENDYIKSLILLGISCITVESSNMTRRADLRRRRENEYKNRIVNVPHLLSSKLNEVIEDLKSLPKGMKKTIKVSNDARIINQKYKKNFDLVVTSPPYLNGTNYIRNTKLELGILDFINSENQLKTFREQTVCGGINDVSKNRLNEMIEFSYVEEICDPLEKVAYDKRIPQMVRSYFSDMSRVLDNVYFMLKDGGAFILDMGDSKFSGIHIPTDVIIIKIAEEIGFKLIEREVLARRYSRDKTELVQVGLTFQK